MSGLYCRACEATTQEQADAILEECIRFGMESGKSREESKRIQLSNIGYFAGYYGHEVRLRVERLYQTVHPIFGAAANGQPTPEEALRKGMELGRKAGAR